MNRKLISKAISNIDDAFIEEAMSAPAVTAHTPERTPVMKHSRKILRLLTAACLILALALSAYAFNFLGIRDMFHDLPESADPYIQEHTEAAIKEDWSARITESFCDESTVMVTVTVSSGDRYILAPTDADPDTLAINIGIEGELTLGEYAAQQGKELLFVGASLKENGALGGIGSQSFRNTAPNEMTILIKSTKTAALTENEIICHVYAVDAQWNKQTLDIPFSLTEAPADSSIYIPNDAGAIPGLRVGNATITETPMGYTIRYMESVTSEEVWDNIKKVEFDGLAYGKGGTVLENDGNWYLTVSGCTGNVGNSLTARYYNWDDQVIGVIEFVKK